MSYKILQITPNSMGTQAVAVVNGKKERFPIVCWGLRYSIREKGTEDEWEDYEVVGMTYYERDEEPKEWPRNGDLVFVDEDQGETYQFLGYE
jgi:hypothetical protein